MDRIPLELRNILREHGYDCLDALPGTLDSLDWIIVKQECDFSSPSLFKVKNAIFPSGKEII